MVIELSLGGLLTLLGIPTAITSLGLWMLQRKMAKREEIRDKREAAREKNEVLLIQNTRAALALAEAIQARIVELSRQLAAQQAASGQTTPLCLMFCACAERR